MKEASLPVLVARTQLNCTIYPVRVCHV